jgi:hypothetical protein
VREPDLAQLISDIVSLVVYIVGGLAATYVLVLLILTALQAVIR